MLCVTFRVRRRLDFSNMKNYNLVDLDYQMRKIKLVEIKKLK